MHKKHLLSLLLGILLILIGTTIIPVGLYYSDYLRNGFPEVNFEAQIQQHNMFESRGEPGVFESIISIVGLDKVFAKIDDIIEEQRQLRNGYTSGFYDIQAEIKYIMQMQSIYLIVTTIIISIFFIVFGVICLAFHALLIHQSKIYLLEESIKNEIAIYREDR